MAEALVVAAGRTGVARAGGALAAHRPDELAGDLLRLLLERAGLEVLDDALLGCGAQAGEQAANFARAVVLLSGLAPDVPAITVHGRTAAGLRAVELAALAVASGYREIVAAGGADSCSRVPPEEDLFVAGARATVSLRLHWAYEVLGPLEAADLLARRDGLSREELDEWTARSRQRATSAPADDELVLPEPPDDPLPAVDAADLAREPVLLPGGRHAGHAVARPADAAAFVVLASPEAARRHGLRPLGRVASAASAGDDPTLGWGAPALAARRALERVRMEAGNVDIYDVDEPYAAVPLTFARALGVPVERLNPRGGALALGHPRGASGAVRLVALLAELARSGKRFGMCVAAAHQGLATAILVDREVYA